MRSSDDAVPLIGLFHQANTGSWSGSVRDSWTLVLSASSTKGVAQSKTEVKISSKMADCIDYWEFLITDFIIQKNKHGPTVNNKKA